MSSKFIIQCVMQKDFRVGVQKMRTYLLQIKNMVVEIILQLFVGIIDAELLKAVGLEVLKAKNVQNTNGQTLKNNSKNRNECDGGKFRLRT